MAKGNIGVTSDNIFPVIKKFLYSDHEIFLRELVSNAVDATQKLKTLSLAGEFKGEMGDTRVRVKIDKDHGTLTVSDHGIGMTQEEVDKYINQIAFSGAEEFVNKYKDNAQAIIGHFGLGFYSAFMVSTKVEIFSQSYKEDAPAVHWSCDGSPSYDMEETIKAERGTDIVLHIDEEFKQYLEQATVKQLLNKYCKFLPVEIACGKKTEWKEGKEVELDEDDVINDTNPAWTRKPADLTEEDYKKFYHQLYPMQFEEPLFHIHLNVDYPFNLTGILYFPKFKPHMDATQNKIQLYCNQVFVTDEVENIVPQYLTLLHGVIDSPDIPLNVSRSYLQSDNNVKKISAHITKKVADELAKIFKDSREDFEQKWKDIQIFIQYGMLSDEKFYERAEKFCLLQDVKGKYYTLDEFKTAVKDAQTDKDGQLVVLYADNKDAQYSYIQRAEEKGYTVLLMDTPFDVHCMSQFEQKWEKTHFVRVDSDVIENLIKKEDKKQVELTQAQKAELNGAFSSQLPVIEKTQLNVTFENVGEDALPVFITQDEYMRRMKEMQKLQGGGGMYSFYGEMPDSYNVVLNTAHPLVTDILRKEDEACAQRVADIAIPAEPAKLDDKATDDEKKAHEEEMTAYRDAKSKYDAQVDAIYSEFASGEPRIKQLIDIALLASGLLKGEQLAQFVKRSVSLL